MLKRHRWIGYGLVAVAVALVPWTVFLTLTLPSRHVAEHWDTAWVGFDVGEFLAVLLTAIALLRRTNWLQGAAAAAGTMLLCDAWFDTLLSNGDERILVAIGEAFVSEVPLAVLCFWIALDTARFWTRWEELRER